MKRAIKGSLPSPAITELLLRRNYLGNETNLKLTACGKPDVHYMGTLTHTHTHIFINAHSFGLKVLAVKCPTYSWLDISVRACAYTTTFITKTPTHAHEGA